ncbi:MAG: DNA-deoxyinosine glycosylase [Epsilonproteobacteria bacterium]|nr:DNA-deoxyinosine glycosylase [Campylobacterota bacterium]
MRYYHPFEPVVFEDSKILILGSFPSIKSFEDNFYYAHPKNQFWPILSEIFSMPADTKEQKIELLKKNKIALWDSAKSCEREGSSLDSNLKNCEVNDFRSFLIKYPNIKAIFFTGRKAEALFKKHFKDISLPLILLPSPSPAYAVMKKEDKLKRYRELLFKYLKEEK